jgi:hypothetical protein
MSMIQQTGGTTKGAWQYSDAEAGRCGDSVTAVEHGADVGPLLRERGRVAFTSCAHNTDS